MADVNDTQTDIGFDDHFRALIVSALVGWNGKADPIPLQLGVGGAYWDAKSTDKPTVDVPRKTLSGLVLCRDCHGTADL